MVLVIASPFLSLGKEVVTIPSPTSSIVPSMSLCKEREREREREIVAMTKREMAISIHSTNPLYEGSVR